MKKLPKAQRTHGIACFDSINTFSSKQKLQRAWSNLPWFCLAKGEKYIRDAVIYVLAEFVR